MPPKDEEPTVEEILKSIKEIVKQQSSTQGKKPPKGVKESKSNILIIAIIILALIWVVYTLNK